jgi:hypothetical protein
LTTPEVDQVRAGFDVFVQTFSLYPLVVEVRTSRGYNYLYRADELEPWAERKGAPGAVYETYRDVLADFAGPEDQFVGSASFVDGRALNG